MKTILIVGGGFPGLVTALSCAQLGYQVRLFDVKESLMDSQNHAFKPIVINASSWRLFSALGCSDQLIEYAYPLANMHVLRQDWARFSFNADGHRFPYLGYVIMGHQLQNTISEAVLAHPNITCYLGVKLTALDLKPKPQLTVGKRSFNGDLLVACDGMRSWCRQQQNIPYEQKSWHKKAMIIPTLMKEVSTDAYLRFTEFGTIACLPTQKSHHQLILTAQSDHSLFTYESEHIQTLAQDLLGDIGQINHCEKPVVFDLQEGFAPQVATPGMVLLGDAGFSIPPVGAQGLNLAFYDIGVLADLLAESLSTGQALASKRFADRYNDIVMIHHKNLLDRVGYLVNLFNLQNPILQVGHGLGLKIMNHVGLFKKYIAEFGMGLRYPVPSLLRGRQPDVYMRVKK
ncbi:MAG: hypothetical protein CMF42_00145 [Legionellales bacterium]|nr:hypothetical protein [Legionellales bacterium]|tara:strand:- start:3027 stop:4229 length:1203 start_codon:yes stop_codon:yes gene_type:complete